MSTRRDVALAFLWATNVQSMGDYILWYPVHHPQIFVGKGPLSSFLCNEANMKLWALDMNCEISLVASRRSSGPSAYTMEMRRRRVDNFIIPPHNRLHIARIERSIEKNKVGKIRASWYAIFEWTFPWSGLWVFCAIYVAWVSQWTILFDMQSDCAYEKDNSQPRQSTRKRSKQVSPTRWAMDSRRSGMLD